MTNTVIQHPASISGDMGCSILRDLKHKFDGRKNDGKCAICNREKGHTVHFAEGEQ